MTEIMYPMKQGTELVNGIKINYCIGGEGLPILFLHGYPQSSIMWRKVAPKMSKKYKVICPDLRGYGDSDKPYSGYDKKTMANDMYLLMNRLGLKKYHLVGHDRGARVAHRFAVDYPENLLSLTVLDIVPTLTMFTETSKEIATAYWHWFFFQARDISDLMIQNSAEPFLRHIFRSLSFISNAIEDKAFNEYLRVFQIPGTIRATLEDYRVAAKEDIDDDRKDLNKKISCPVLSIWGEFGKLHSTFDVLTTWKDRAKIAQGYALKCGHFIPEELPDELILSLENFFKK